MEGFEFATVHYVAALGFLLAAVFGFVANKTNFCTMGAVSDMLHMGSRGRLGAWFFAMGTAILGTQALHGAGLVDLEERDLPHPQLRPGSATSPGASPSASA